MAVLRSKALTSTDQACETPRGCLKLIHNDNDETNS